MRRRYPHPNRSHPNDPARQPRPRHRHRPRSIATARIEYLNGCVQFCVKPPLKDGTNQDGLYIDQQQLEIVDNGIFDKIHPTPTGGPSQYAPRGDRYAG